MAAFLLAFLLLLATAGHSSGSWCVCKEGLSDAVLQKTLDYACGAGADCNPIHQTAPCFNPNTVRAHCSYAVNSYFQKYRQAPIACDFSGTASVVTSDPSTAGCAYPATVSATTGTPTTTNPTGGSPLVTTPSTGTTGGTNTGLGPSGGNNDIGVAGILVPDYIVLCFSMILALLGLVSRWA
ncbi:plasmodesmata callose-binding protein 2 [Sesamum alatum]|uniref:Plasmodesmata callose-binding protein 2 n=1 Tax=Sesamum alatum TaxID=300844 RepID=A0AAE1YUI5_9LAMI|nr:plasmodesmata callose-binding protein 2 [Sesamum alatum]